MEHNIMMKPDFFLLDDTKHFNITTKQADTLIKLFKVMEEYYNCNFFTFEKLSDLMFEELLLTIEKNDVELLITLGTGGKYLLNSMRYKKEIATDIINIKCQKINSDIVKIEKNILFSAKKIVLLDDVLATGDTIINVNNYLNKLGNQTIKAFVGVMNGQCAFNAMPLYYSISVGCLDKPIIKKDELYWYPPIFSLRHIINHENGLSCFAEIFAVKYFKNDERIKSLINQFL